jgi:hypothetical protein
VTTVAFRDGVMAADSLGTDEMIGKCRLQKIRRVKVKGKEHLIGVCGHFEASLLFAEWYGSRSDKIFDRITRFDKDSDFSVLIWTGKKLFTADRMMLMYEAHEDYYAIGTGASYAITAMDCGKSAAQAVQMAMKRDINTGGRVVTARL